MVRFRWMIVPLLLFVLGPIVTFGAFVVYQRAAPSAKLAPADAEKALDQLWGDYHWVDDDRPISSEVAFRRKDVRNKVRAILRQYPDWAPYGPNGKTRTDRTRAEGLRALNDNEEHDKQ